MKKIVKIIVILVVILLIVVGIILGIKTISDSANKVNKEYENDKIKLQENYDKFSSYITEYNSSREDLVVLLQGAMYYEDFPKVNESIHNFYVSYDELINKINLSINEIESACKREYMEEEYNTMCDSYQAIYEKIINVYIEDVNTYNGMIKGYNEWVGEEKYPAFNSQYAVDYVDYNNDNIYDGKVEE